MLETETTIETLIEENKRLSEELKWIKERLWCSECELPRGGLLSDRDIKRLILKGRINVTPLPNLEDETILGTCKLDLHLGAEALVLNSSRVKRGSIDLSEPIPEEYFDNYNLQKLGTITIGTNKLVVATVLERVILPDDISGRLEGKSGIARRGGAVEAAPIFDAGWDGHPMLELHNIGELPIIVHFGSPICAMSFEHMISPTFKSYANRDGIKYGIQKRAQI